ncbi:hypothetical protein ELI_1744 [Eubacterium callanderi]|uniref:Uncharacterized protein n=1 Tax=Eubacterium callanderi TaxID=53442 RepID=E3GMA2_9FIRM|nr:hypothetical protein ELI_1744 [Eubacterium callanderi]
MQIFINVFINRRKVFLQKTIKENILFSNERKTERKIRVVKN